MTLVTRNPAFTTATGQSTAHLASEPDPGYLQRASITGTLVDSCVLIDLLANDPNWANWSIEKLDQCSRQGALVINPLILAEISPRFETANDLDAALSAVPLVRTPLPWDAAFLAGQAFKVYRLGRGTNASPMPDFYIGAHALVAGLQLLTRDVARYSRYFPRLPLVSP
jgi:predicted nucleic acid-binding protein